MSVWCMLNLLTGMTHTFDCTIHSHDIIGASRPPTFFLFRFFPPPFLVFQWSIQREENTVFRWYFAEICTYAHSSPAVIKYFTCSHISLKYGHFWSKNYSKKHSVGHNIVMKSPIGLIFCRNMLMDSLKGQFKMV